MSSIADRSEPRIAIELDAIVHPERGRTWACTIRDFCGSGMLLEGAEANRARSLRDSGVDARNGDEIHVHFSVPGTGGGRNYRLTAVVRRVMENAVGVLFPDGMAMRAFQALQEYAQSHRPGGEGGAEEARDDDRPMLAEADAERLQSQVRRLAARALPSLYKGFFDRASEELIVLARDAGSNARQNELFEALNAIEGNAKDVARDAGRQVLDHIAKPRERSMVVDRRSASKDGGLDSLSLVDTSAFEDWLAVADIISKAENRFANDLAPLHAQLGRVARGWSEKDIMPLGPTVLAATFDDAMNTLELPRDIRQMLYGYFRDALVAFLRKLLPALQKLLDASGLVPRSDEIGDEAWRRSKPRPTPAAPTPVPEQAPEVQPEEGSAQEGAPAVTDTQEMAAYRPGDSGSWAPGAVTPRPPRDPGATTQMFQAIGAEQAGALASAAANVYGPVSRAPMGDVFGTARELMQLRRGLPGPDGLPAEMPLARDVQPAAETVYSSDEIRAALTELRRVPGTVPPGGDSTPSVRRRLEDALAASTGAKQFAPEARDALEVVDDLIGTIRGDTILPESVKGWLAGC